MSVSMTQVMDRAWRAQREALERFSENICDQRVDPQHRAWILLASSSFQVHPVILEAVYLVERYHRRWFWRMTEAIVTLLHYGMSRLLGLSLPDYSIGICQVKPSTLCRARMWRQGRKTCPQVMPVRDMLSLGDFINLLRTRENIFAAAEVLSYELRDTPVRVQLGREVAQTLVENHFGLGSWPESSWVSLADLLYLVTSAVHKRSPVKRLHPKALH